MGRDYPKNGKRVAPDAWGVVKQIFGCHFGHVLTRFQPLLAVLAHISPGGSPMWAGRKGPRMP